jgi:hypothetical protein
MIPSRVLSEYMMPLIVSVISGTLETAPADVRDELLKSIRLREKTLERCSFRWTWTQLEPPNDKFRSEGEVQRFESGLWLKGKRDSARLFENIRTGEGNWTLGRTADGQLRSIEKYRPNQGGPPDDCRAILEAFGLGVRGVGSQLSEALSRQQTELKLAGETLLAKLQQLDSRGGNVVYEIYFDSAPPFKIREHRVYLWPGETAYTYVLNQSYGAIDGVWFPSMILAGNKEVKTSEGLKSTKQLCQIKDFSLDARRPDFAALERALTQSNIDVHDDFRGITKRGSLSKADLDAAANQHAKDAADALSKAMAQPSQTGGLNASPATSWWLWPAIFGGGCAVLFAAWFLNRKRG